WISGDYDSHLAGEYTLNGQLNLPEDVVNRDSIPAFIKVIVGRQYITEISAPDTINTAYGTPFADLPLPEGVLVKFNDGSSGEVAVEWQEGSYKGDAEGLYKLQGLLIPPSEVDNNNDFEAAIFVQVQSRPLKIVSITRPDTVHVTFGTLLNDVLLELPVQSRVTLDNGSPLTVPVSWEPGDYLHDQWGTYALPGTLQLPAGVVNPDDLADTIIVSVSKQFITEVDSLNPLTAAYGTSFGNLPLPADVRVSYNDGTDGMI